MILYHIAFSYMYANNVLTKTRISKNEILVLQFSCVNLSKNY